MACSVTAVDLLQHGCQRLATILILGLLYLTLPAHALLQSMPTITAVQWDPVAVGGTQCANGSGFGGSSGTVNLNGTSVTPSLWSDTQVCAIIPSDTADGSATLQVVAGDSPSNTIGFTVTTLIPSVIGVSPATAAAGAQLTITGTNLDAAQNDSMVQLNGQSLEIMSWSDAQIVATVPAVILTGGIYSLDVTPRERSV